MPGAVEVLHAGLAGATALWALSTLPTLRQPGPARALWIGMVAVGAGEALHLEVVYRAVDAAAGPGWAQVIYHAVGLVAAVAVLDLLHGLLGRPARARRMSAALGAAALVVSALPWLVSPPASVPVPLRGVPAYYDSTWRSALHWGAFLGFLGWALASASWQCAQHARSLSRGPLRTGMALISAGTGAGLLYVAAHASIEAAWAAHRGTGLAGADQLADTATLGWAVGLIVAGAAWQHLLAAVEGLRSHGEAAVLRRRIAVIRPHWEQLVMALPGLSPFADDVRAEGSSLPRLRWQQTRLVVEVYDATRRLLAHLSEEDRALVAKKVTAAGLRGEDARAATDHLCLRASLHRHTATGQPATGISQPVLHAAMSGAVASSQATAQAAAHLAADLRRLRRPTVAQVVTDLSLDLSLDEAHP